MPGSGGAGGITNPGGVSRTGGTGNAGVIIGAGGASMTTCLRYGGLPVPMPTDLQTDNDNCGACGIECSGISPSTAQCVAGSCLVTLASGLLLPDDIAIGAASVYWTNFSGTVMKVPVEGGLPTTLASGQGDPGYIAVDATSVYWTNAGTATFITVPFV